jgi:hypothetical protein
VNTGGRLYVGGKVKKSRRSLENAAGDEDDDDDDNGDDNDSDVAVLPGLAVSS